MPAPGEYKTVQSRILAYAQDIGWTFVPRDEAERRRGFDPSGATPEERARKASLFFGDLLHAEVLAFNPKYKEAEGALIGEFQRFHSDIYGNRDFLTALRNQHKFFCAEVNRELDITLIDYGDLARQPEDWRNIYEVTEEFYFHNGRYGTREDLVFLINGIPVLVIECKNATKDEGIALGVDQIRRYHLETPEVMVPQMLFTATEAIGFDYGATWNTVRRNIFRWKHEGIGNFEAKVKTFCAVAHLLRLLKDFILFAEKDEELQKVVLRQHQTACVDRVVARALDSKLARGLIWHTQGSGKTSTMIKAAEMLFKSPQADKPTVLMMIDRNELEDQMLKNLAAVGLGNVAHAHRIAELNRLLKSDYRGIIVTTIQKFRDMPADINTRANVYVLIDEAHRTTGGPLYYDLAPNEMLVPHEVMEKEFLALAETEGIADIEELNKILERAMNLKNFLKGKERINRWPGTWRRITSITSSGWVTKHSW
jgi:type I restriction enzyme R subunit